jgi:hypothetical protein
MMTKVRAELSEEAPTREDDLDALARMIVYASEEAKDKGLALTSRLLDLAAWSIHEAGAKSPAPARLPRLIRSTEQAE